MTACKQHTSLPVIGYHSCAGCEIEALREENENLKAAQSSVNAAVALENESLKQEAQDLRMKIKEMDLLFGRFLLGNRSAVIEWTDGNGADAAMQWIWNGLLGPGELPSDDERHAQGYFDREIKAIDEGLEQVYAYWDRRREEKAKEGVRG